MKGLVTDLPVQGTAHPDAALRKGALERAGWLSHSQPQHVGAQLDEGVRSKPAGRQPRATSGDRIGGRVPLCSLREEGCDTHGFVTRGACLGPATDPSAIPCGRGRSPSSAPVLEEQGVHSVTRGSEAAQGPGNLPL